MTPLDVFASQPIALKVWLLWLFAINVASVLFVRRPEARWVFGAMLLNLGAMVALLKLYGGGHHMSLPHVVLWTPLLFYLAFRIRQVRTQPRGYAWWLVALFVSDAVSLALDYANVVRMLLA